MELCWQRRDKLPAARQRAGPGRARLLHTVQPVQQKPRSSARPLVREDLSALPHGGAGRRQGQPLLPSWTLYGRDRNVRDRGGHSEVQGAGGVWTGLSSSACAGRGADEVQLHPGGAGGDGRRRPAAGRDGLFLHQLHARRSGHGGWAAGGTTLVVVSVRGQGTQRHAIACGVGGSVQPDRPSVRQPDGLESSRWRRKRLLPLLLPSSRRVGCDQPAGGRY
mmetsp:Transcript_21220/g.47865  ORF Transcript_21220/g.47865 Transcript_21220/m.47865 type:complete len:221 (-) Transcript_21220:1322-1984(-)